MVYKVNILFNKRVYVINQKFVTQIVRLVHSKLTCLLL